MLTARATAAITAAALTLAGTGGLAHAAPSASCQARWAIVASPNVAAQDNVLNAVAGLSHGGAWAVGYHGPDDQALTLTEHWDGASWRIVPSPNRGRPGYTDAYLSGLAAAGPGQVWAVGAFLGTRHFRTLAERFDGTSWTVVPSPSPRGADASLQAVAGISRRDLWAVGVAGPRALIEHWDGTRWRIAATPDTGLSLGLQAVAAVSSRDAWAVGASFGIHGPSPLILHWDGRRWSVARGPALHAGDLHAVTAIARGNIWAAGETGLPSGASRTLVEHFNGTSWRVISSPSPAPGINELNAVAGTSPTAVWAAGESVPAGGDYQTLTERWDGSAWTIVPSPNVKNQNNFLFGITTHGSQAWAVGQHQSFSGSQTLAEAFCSGR